MPLQMTLPEFGQKVDTKDQIVSVLSMEWPLSTKQIYLKLKRHFRSSVTYQAVHKSILNLVERKILVKNEEGYAINVEWLEDVERFVSRIKNNYNLNQKVPFFEGVKSIKIEGDVTVVTFDTIVEADLFIINFKTILKKINIGHARHFWWALLYLQKSFDKQFYGRNKKTYGLCREDTPLDRWAVNFENSIGMHSKICKEIAGNSDLYVYDDYVIQIFFPIDLVEKIDKLFKNTKDIMEIDFKKTFKEIFAKKTEIQVIINKNTKLADSIRKQTLKYF